MARVAIVGAGVAGSVAARELRWSGHHVTLYDLGTRGPGATGGRSSSRAVDSYVFDHGCQFLAPCDADFKALVETLQARGVVERWVGRFGELDSRSARFTEKSQGFGHPGFFGMLAADNLYVAKPSMRELCKHLLATTDENDSAGGSIDVQINTRVSNVRWAAGAWHLDGINYQNLDAREAGESTSFGQFDGLVLTDSMCGVAATPGTLNDGRDDNPLKPFFQQMDEITPVSLFACMLAFPTGLLDVPFDAVNVTNSQSIQFISRDTSKPGREREDSHELWVAISTEEFSQKIIKDMPLSINGVYNPQTPEALSYVTDLLLAEFKDIMQPHLAAGFSFPAPTYQFSQRWGHAHPGTPLKLPGRHACRPDLNFVMAGDFCHTGGVEGAALSGMAAGQHLAELLDAQAMQRC